MATTSVHSIYVTQAQALEYIVNPEKQKTVHWFKILLVLTTLLLQQKCLMPLEMRKEQDVA